MTPRIVVVGSLNMDLGMRMARAPAGGETLMGHGFTTQPGGKGANQAVACARLRAPQMQIAMIGRVGADANGEALRAALIADGIDTEAVEVLEAEPTGVAMIWVEANGQNRIAVAPGANALLDAAGVERAGALIDAASMLIVQLEVPLVAVQAAIERACRAGVTVLMNPAPAAPLPETMWAQIDILVVNESEAAALSGQAVVDAASAGVAAQALRALGPQRVLVTLGERGVVVLDDAGERHVSAHRVHAVDTTAAGDTFVGALAVALCEGRTFDDAVAFGQAASALCVTRPGAQAAIPYRHELRLP